MKRPSLSEQKPEKPKLEVIVNFDGKLFASVEIVGTSLFEKDIQQKIDAKTARLIFHRVKMWAKDWHQHFNQVIERSNDENPPAGPRYGGTY